uniref:Uncharacterized protein n=1 Tax=Panagrolaimus davidi TaxID=227884 RepID=A0A914QJC2_9BILA
MNNQSMSSSSNFQQNNPSVITIDIVASERSQMSARRSSCIPEYVQVPCGDFCKTEEIVRGKPVIRLYVKEPGLENGCIRKYTPKMVNNTMKWYCTQCNTRRNSRANSNKFVAMKTTNVSPKEAKYNVKTNVLFVSENHNSCKPFEGEIYPKSKENDPTVRSALINKRNKISMDQTDTEQSTSPIDNEIYGNDFDDQFSRNSTPVNFDVVTKLLVSYILLLILSFLLLVIFQE